MICGIPFETKSLCCFATYNTDEKLDQYKIDYINELSRHFEHVVISINCHISNQNKLKSNTSFNFTENKGLDFGLHWNVFHKIMATNRYNFEQIGLVNDSCMLINKLDEVFHWGSNYNFWGITLSHDYDDHIQSYFIIFRGERVIDSLFEFIKYNDVYKCKNRKQIITNFEIGLSQHMKKNGICLHALYDQPFIYNIDTQARKTASLNPSFHQWNSLISFGCPLIKISRAKFAGDVEFINRIKNEMAENRIKLIAMDKTDLSIINVKKNKDEEMYSNSPSKNTENPVQTMHKKITDLAKRKKEINEMFKKKFLHN